MGYSAISEAFNRGKRYLEGNNQLKKMVRKIINDI